MEIQINFVPLKTLGYMECVLPQDILDAVNADVEKIIESKFQSADKMNNNLYGAIEHEYKLKNFYCSVLLEKFTSLVAREFYKVNNFFSKDSPNFRLNNCWVNFQQKNEYNPLHFHEGDYSFVIWLEIPYTIQHEKELPNIKNSNGFQNEASSFVFVYPDFLGKGGINKKIIQVDQTYRGKMIFFDATTQHMVYPFFTSNDFRISVSGNLSILN